MALAENGKKRIDKQTGFIPSFLTSRLEIAIPKCQAELFFS